MTEPFIVTTSFPHQWRDGFNRSAPSLEAAEAIAASYTQGRFGQEEYCQVRIYSLVREVN